ncbi:hypothetical protein B296_00040368 [Ensete ventricosum]|uniref:Uncharacterized protein n=1 Tax=Ensete ventricosum TaxID=4639 RepID=A0A426WY34_ENSVE|nr:hypothetical protein B296_00040368 [Ensete ventricosum]
MYTNRRTRTNMSISSNIMFILLSVTFSPTYSFNVLVEATVDVASPRILLNLESSALATTCPFGSQPLPAAHSCINPKFLTFGYLDEKPIDTGLMKFLGLCHIGLGTLSLSLHSSPPRPFLRPMLSLHESKGSMTSRKSRLYGTMMLLSS